MGIAPQVIPHHIDAAIRALGVIPPRHMPVYKPTEEPYKAWKPTPDDKEPPW